MAMGIREDIKYYFADFVRKCTYVRNPTFCPIQSSPFIHFHTLPSSFIQGVCLGLF